jgi:hypothetical protein
MQFLIAHTFTDGLARLTSEEQKAVKTTAFDLQVNLANPGTSFHKLDKGRDKNFWLVRVSSDIRLIVTRPLAVCCFATSTIGTKPMTGPNAVISKCIPDGCRSVRRDSGTRRTSRVPVHAIICSSPALSRLPSS